MTGQLRIQALSQVAAAYNLDPAAWLVLDDASGGSTRKITINDVAAWLGAGSCATPERYNLGSDQANIAAALAAGSRVVRLQDGRTYSSLASLGVPAGTILDCSGAILNSSANAEIFDIQGDDVTILNPRFVGNAAGTAQHGVRNGDPTVDSSGFYRTHIVGATASGLGGSLFKHSQAYAAHHGAKMLGCEALNCGYGVLWTDKRGEYVDLAGCSAHNGTYGYWFGGGNINVDGGKVTGATYGIHLEGGASYPNDTHGIIHGVQFNHCGHPFDLKNGTLGEIFDACAAYQGDMILDGFLGALFSKCFIDVDNYYFKNGTTARFSGVMFPRSYGNVLAQYDSSCVVLVDSDCRFDLSGRSTVASNHYKGVYTRVTLASPITLAHAGALASGATVVFDTISENKIAFWGNFPVNVYQTVGGQAGQFLNFGYGDGHVRYHFAIALTKNAADDWNAVDVQVQLSGSTYSRMNIKVLSTTSAVAYWDGVITHDYPTGVNIFIQASGFANDLVIATSGTVGIAEGL